MPPAHTGIAWGAGLTTQGGAHGSRGPWRWGGLGRGANGFARRKRPPVLEPALRNSGAIEDADSSTPSWRYGRPQSSHDNVPRYVHPYLLGPQSRTPARAVVQCFLDPLARNLGRARYTSRSALAKISRGLFRTPRTWRSFRYWICRTAGKWVQLCLRSRSSNLQRHFMLPSHLFLRLRGAHAVAGEIVRRVPRQPPSPAPADA